MKRIKYWVKKALGLWPPKKDSAKRLIYDLSNADEDCKGKH